MLQSELNKKKAKITNFNNELDYLDDQISNLLRDSTKLGMQLSAINQESESARQIEENSIRQKIKNIKETVDGMKQNRREFKEMIEGLEKEVIAAEKTVVPDPKPASPKLDVANLGKFQSGAQPSPLPRSQISVVASNSPSITAAQNALHDTEGSSESLKVNKVTTKSQATIPGSSALKATSTEPSASGVADSNVNIKVSQVSYHDEASVHSGTSSKIIGSAVSGIGQIANRNIIERTEHSSLHSATSEAREDVQKSGIGQGGVRNIVNVDATVPRQKRELVNTGIGKVPDWIRKKQEEKEKLKAKVPA